MDEESVESLIISNDDPPKISRTFAPWKILMVTISLVSMVLCMAKVAPHTAPGTAGVVKETVELATWDDSIETPGYGEARDTSINSQGLLIHWIDCIYIYYIFIYIYIYIYIYIIHIHTHI